MFNAREDIIRFFEKGIFPFKGNVFKTKEESKEESKEEEIERFINNGIALTERESKGINNDLFKKHFDLSTPINLAKKLFKIKDANKNCELVGGIKNRWGNLKDKIEEMSKEIKNEKPNEILGIINEILSLNKDVQEQHGSGFKILTPNQMLSRLPMSLAQLKAGNNSKKLTNEIRKLLYSLYRSKKHTKQIYKSLIDTI